MPPHLGLLHAKGPRRRRRLRRGRAARPQSLLPFFHVSSSNGPGPQTFGLQTQTSPWAAGRSHSPSPPSPHRGLAEPSPNLLPFLQAHETAPAPRAPSPCLQPAARKKLKKKKIKKEIKPEEPAGKQGWESGGEKARGTRPAGPRGRQLGGTGTGTARGQTTAQVRPGHLHAVPKAPPPRCSPSSGTEQGSFQLRGAITEPRSRLRAPGEVAERVARPGDAEGVPGGGGGGGGGGRCARATVAAAEFRSRQLSSPLGGGDAEAKPAAGWTRAGGGGGARGSGVGPGAPRGAVAGTGMPGVGGGRHTWDERWAPRRLAALTLLLLPPAQLGCAPHSWRGQERPSVPGGGLHLGWPR